MGRIDVLNFLLLLFVGTVANSMAVSFMGYYLIEGLEQEPWTISAYAGLSCCIVILANRFFARQMDRGANPFLMVGIAVSGFAMASVALSMSPTFWTVVTFGAIGFGVGSSAMSTKFALGGIIADRHDVKRSTFNAYMRATTSTSWMIGPALSFTTADQWGPSVVFDVFCVVALIWSGLWWWATPRDAASRPQTTAQSRATKPKSKFEMQVAVVFVFCLTLAHSLTFSALPIFFVKEIGLPGYAPGTAFSLKTLVELCAILSSPFLIARFGLRISLLGTAMLAVVSILVLAKVQSYPHMLFGAALEGLYYGLFSTLAISFVQSLSKDRPAYATAVYWNTVMATLIIAGPLAGLIAQVFDFRTVIYTASGFALASFLILVTSAQRRCLNLKAG